MLSHLHFSEHCQGERKQRVQIDVKPSADLRLDHLCVHEMFSSKLHIEIYTIKHRHAQIHTHMYYWCCCHCLFVFIMLTAISSPRCWELNLSKLKTPVKIWLVKDAPQYVTAAQPNHARMTAFLGVCFPARIEHAPQGQPLSLPSVCALFLLTSHSGWGQQQNLPTRKTHWSCKR